MRLFFIEWSGKEFGMTEVVKRLRENKHEIVYWSGYNLDMNIEKSEFPNTIFHDYYDARAGIGSPQVDESSFCPPSEALIKSMYETESKLLIMMNKRYEWMRENEKKHLYYKYLRYWDGVINKYKPDAIIGPSAPHTIYDLVLFDLAKLYGIKTIMFELTAINNRAIVMNDYVEGCKVLQKQLVQDEGKNYSVADFESDVRKYYENQMNPNEASTPEIVKVFSKRYSVGNILKYKIKAIFSSFKKDVFFERLGNRVFSIGKGNLKKEYEQMQTEVDFSKKYIYLPLQNQPEATTSPLGGIFVDQLLAIETLSFCLPKDWLIYVKEHPFQWKPRGLIYFAFRYKGFYESITKLKNVRIVPIKTDTYKLIENAQVITSVSGTAPWEGLFRNKPGIIFGYPWYRGVHGIFQVRNIDQCREALNRINDGFKIDHQKLINFLVSFQKITLNAFRDSYNKQISPIGIEQNIKNQIEMINRGLKEV